MTNDDETAEVVIAKDCGFEWLEGRIIQLSKPRTKLSI